MKIHVSRREIERAYKNHRYLIDSSNKGLGDTEKMVFFYAVECGLKAVYMGKNRLERSDKKEHDGKSVEDISHDLNKILKLLRIDNKYKLPKVDGNDGHQIEPKDMHQAWRYGKEVDGEKEKTYIKALEKVLKMLKNKLQR